MTARSRVRARLWLALRTAVTLGAFAYLLGMVDRRALWQALTATPPWAFGAAIAATVASLGVGALRWRLLLDTYGAPSRPPMLTLARLYLIGLFYNSFLPGAVGGDVVRGVATRRAFGEAGAAASLSVVLVERLLGLAGLVALVAGAFTLRPVAGVDGAVPLMALGLTGALAAIPGIALGRRLAPRLPAPLARVAERLPRVERLAPLVLAGLISVVSHVLPALAGYALVSAAAPSVTLGDALVLVPLAMAAAFFPITIAGAGAREAAFVALFAGVGVARADALAASLAMLGAQLTVAAAGGLVALLSPVGAADDRAT
jgi:hypothetical protein